MHKDGEDTEEYHDEQNDSNDWFHFLLVETTGSASIQINFIPFYYYVIDLAGDSCDNLTLSPQFTFPLSSLL